MNNNTNTHSTKYFPIVTPKKTSTEGIYDIACSLILLYLKSLKKVKEIINVELMRLRKIGDKYVTSKTSSTQSNKISSTLWI